MLLPKIPESQKNRFYALLILFAVFWSFAPSLDNKFINLDDPDYLLANKYIQHLSWTNAQHIFQNTILGSYQPLTLLTFAIEHSIAGFNPALYHFDNLLLHLLNCLLVYGVISLLCKRREVALLTALFFGLHPLRVESVAWITERKDVLFALFYLAALGQYIVFILRQKRAAWILALVFFALACLAKPQAVSFPLAMMAVDLFYRRPLVRRVALEKMPFFLLALAVLAVNAVGVSAWLNDQPGVHAHSIVDKFFFTTYALMLYLGKQIAPVGLSVLYPFPVKADSALPWDVYVSAIGIFTLLTIGILRCRNNRYLVFGGAWFLATILLPLGNIWLGAHLMADRFTYLASIGFFFALASAVVTIYERSSTLVKTGMAVVITIYLAWFGWSTAQRCEVWRNNFTLWTDVIDQFPDISLAYNNRGAAFSEAGRDDLAMADYAKALALDPGLAMAYFNRGQSDLREKRYAAAFDDFSTIVQLKPNYAPSYNGRGIALGETNQTELSILDFNKATQLDPEMAEAYYNRGRAYVKLGRLQLAIADLNRAIDLDPGTAMYYFEKGLAHMTNKQYASALEAFDTAIKLDPSMTESYNNRGIIYDLQGQMSLAIANYTEVIKNKPQNAYEAYVNRGNLYQKQNKYQLALDDYNQAITLDPQAITAYVQRANVYFINRQYLMALKEFDKILAMAPDDAQTYYNRSIIYKNLNDYDRALKDALKAKALGYDVNRDYLDGLAVHASANDHTTP